MADNVIISQGTAGTLSTIATDDVGSVQYQKIKLDIGGDGASSPFTGTVPEITNVAGGSVVVTGGTISTQNTVGTVGVVESGSVVVTNGTVASVGTVPGVGVVGNINGGSIVVTNGTVTTTIGDITGGTIDQLTDGTVQVKGGSVVMTAGTVSTLNTVGTVGVVNSGSIVVTSGTIADMNTVGTVGVLEGGTLGQVTSVSNVADGSVVVKSGTIASMPGQYAEDSAHSTGATGNLIVGVRNDNGTALAGTDLDYIPLTTDSNGNLRTNASLSGTIDAVTNIVGGTVVAYSNTAKDGSGTDYVPLVDTDGHLQVDVLSGGGGGVQYAEDSAHTSGGTGPMILAVRNDNGTALAGTDLDYIPLTTDSNGNLRTTASASIGTISVGTVNTGTINTGTIDVLKNGTISQLGDGVDTLDIVQSGDAGGGGGILVHGLETGGGNVYPLSVDIDGKLFLQTDYRTNTAYGTSNYTNLISGVRNDNGTALATANLRMQPLNFDSNGKLWTTAVVTAGTISSITADLPGGTIDTVSSVSNVVNGTLAQVTSVSNVADGSVVVKSGTIASMPGQYAEDTAHSTGATGNLILGVRNDNGTAIAGTDLDYIPLTTDSNGNLRTTASLAGTLDEITNIVGGSIVVTSGTVNTGTISALPDLPGGTIDSITNLAGGTVNTVSSVSNVVNGTLAQVTSVSNVAGGSIVVTAGTVSSLPDLPGGTVDVVTSVSNVADGTVSVDAGTITAGTINAGTITAGTINSATITAGTINTGTVSIDQTPVNNVLSYSTTGTASIGTLIAAPGVGTSIILESVSMVVHNGTSDVMIGYGTAQSGTTVVERGLFTAGGGISKDYSHPIGKNITNTALVYDQITGTGTVTYTVKYYTE